MPEKRPHDPVNHLAFDISDKTKRLKSHELHQPVEYKLRSAEVPIKNQRVLRKCAPRCNERRLQRSWNLSRTEKLAWERAQEQEQDQKQEQDQEQEQESEQDLFL